jgi:hypothetical protein
MNKKSFKAPTNFSFCINNILLLGKTIQKWSHLLQISSFTPAHTPMYTTSSLLGGKCNMILSFDKS